MTAYLGRVYTDFATRDGTVEYRWMYSYHVNGERKFTHTEAEAREAVSRHLAKVA